jgi:hypothetical protein
MNKVASALNLLSGHFRLTPATKIALALSSVAGLTLSLSVQARCEELPSYRTVHAIGIGQDAVRIRFGDTVYAIPHNYLAGLTQPQGRMLTPHSPSRCCCQILHLERPRTLLNSTSRDGTINCARFSSMGKFQGQQSKS